MSLEDLTGTNKFIDAFVVTNPTGSDPKNQGDDHVRGVKNVLANSFPNITGAMTVTHTALNAISTTYLSLGGGTMTGQLKSTVPIPFEFKRSDEVGFMQWKRGDNTTKASFGSSSISQDIFIDVYNTAGTTYNRTLFKESGNIELSPSVTPTTAQDLTTKDYVDSLAVPNIVTFTSSGTYTKPSNLIGCKVTVIGGGAGGANSGTGGGAGGCAIKTYTDADLSATTAITIGAGGSSSHNGNTTTFSASTAISATGGTSSSGGTKPFGGSGSGGDLNINGGAGNYAAATDSTPEYGGSGGDSFIGTGGCGGLPTNENGENGTIGGGGGGRHNTGAPGAGGNGIVIIEEYLS